MNVPENSWSQTALALALFFGPLLVGWIAGRATSRLHFVWILAADGILALAGFAAVAVAHVGLWDALLTWLLLALGVVVGRAALRPARLALVLAATSAGLVIVELGLHLVPPSPPLPFFRTRLVVPAIDPRTLDTTSDHPDFNQTADVAWCELLYVDEYPHYFELISKRDEATKPAVLYVGDSMTLGFGLPPGDAFPALEKAWLPELAHVNAGASGTAPDFYFAAAKHWLRKIPAQLVVVGLYAGNDFEVDAPIACCDGGPLLAYPSDGPAVERCPKPRFPPGWGTSFAWTAKHSPPPLPLLLGAPHSELLRRAARFFHEITLRLAWESAPFPSGDSALIRTTHVRQALAALRDEARAHGARVAFVVLPDRRDFESSSAADAPGRIAGLALANIGTGLGVPTFDAWPLFHEAVERGGVESVFLPFGDVHFNRAGHQLVATWLGPKLAEIVHAP